MVVFGLSSALVVADALVVVVASLAFVAAPAVVEGAAAAVVLVTRVVGAVDIDVVDDEVVVGGFL